LHSHIFIDIDRKNCSHIEKIVQIQVDLNEVKSENTQEEDILFQNHHGFTKIDVYIDEEQFRYGRDHTGF